MDGRTALVAPGEGPSSSSPWRWWCGEWRRRRRRCVAVVVVSIMGGWSDLEAHVVDAGMLVLGSRKHAKSLTRSRSPQSLRYARNIHSRPSSTSNCLHQPPTTNRFPSCTTERWPIAWFDPSAFRDVERGRSWR